MTFRSMPSVPFTSPITTAAISAVPNPLTTNPGTKRATSSRHNALNTQCASIRPIVIRLTNRSYYHRRGDGGCVV